MGKNTAGVFSVCYMKSTFSRRLRKQSLPELARARSHLPSYTGEKVKSTRGKAKASSLFLGNSRKEGAWSKQPLRCPCCLSRMAEGHELRLLDRVLVHILDDLTIDELS